MADSDLVIDMAWRMDALSQMHETIGGRWANDPVLGQSKVVQNLLATRTDIASSLVNTNTIISKVDTILSNQATILSNQSSILNGVGTVKSGVAQIINILTNTAPNLTAEEIRTIIREELDRPPTP